MNTCKDCRFWLKPERNEATCKHPALYNTWAYPFPEETANGGEHNIVTGPDFGCIHWTGKPPQEAK